MLASKSVNNLGSSAIERLSQLPVDSHEGGESNFNSTGRTGSHEIMSSTGRDLITYIFPDIRAVEYFRKDFVASDEFHILEKAEASGFEIYLVDQWVRDRKIGSVASVFTGNTQSRVKVCKLTTLKKLSKEYPPRFQEYLNELLLNHATFKKMDNVSITSSLDSVPTDESSEIPSYLLVSNISAMPHNLFLIPIPGGDARAIERTYMVNSNLKKLNCGGRSLSLLAEKVSDASEDKFRQMYCILNESVPIQFAILELINIVQICLFYFDLLDAKYADGLLCHKTEDAIKNWWNLVGLPHFNTKPHHKSGVLSSKSVAAIISLTVSVKLRLHLIGGCDVPKDVFDAENFMLSVGHFQRQVKIEKRRKLNLLTLSRLFYYTNPSHLSEKHKSIYSPFGIDPSFDDTDQSNFYDQSYASPMSSGKNAIYSNTSLPSQAASAYRRNKIYYSKELKKLTNVVKNTVQDHIMVKEDQDDLYLEPPRTKPTTKLRSKIVSKLSENLVPADIETCDIEVFFKKCIVGKTLLRLWMGLSAADLKLANDIVDEGKKSSSMSSNDYGDGVHASRTQNENHRHHHRYHRDDRDVLNGLASVDNLGYTFVSFRDSFAIYQDLNQTADKSGRLGKMKLPFQNRKALVKSGDGSTRAFDSEVDIPKDKAQNTLLDTELQKLTESPPSVDAKFPSKRKSIVADTKTGVISTLHRRSSYPLANSAIEANLGTIEASHNEDGSLTLHVQSLHRSASFSALQDYFYGTLVPPSHEKIRNQYLENATKVVHSDLVKRDCSRTFAEKIATKVKRLNFENQKISTTNLAMLNRKLRFETEYSAILDFRMRDLADNLDKMAFRSRDLLKKIDELDEQLRIFKSKIDSESLAKLGGMISRVLHSEKFDRVFQNQDEKLQIVKSLTGSEQLHDERESVSSSSGWCIRQFVVFIYEIALIVLSLFHFDRSKMNLDRIRDQYRKLDPNRKYMRRAYKFVGRIDTCDEAATDSDEN